MLLREEDRKIRLFLSVDAVGSTEFKTQKANADPLAWSRFFQGFFTEFSLFLKGSLEKSAKTRKSPTALPTLWKLLGDEIIYSAVIRDEYDAFILLREFADTVVQYDTEKANRSEPRVKGTAWIAGFPIRNYEVQVSAIEEGAQYPNDYIGLDMDIGFRLSHFSRAGRVAISMDLADVITREENYKNELKCCHLGWERLKGVFSNQPYPLLWVTRDGMPEPHPLSPWQEHECKLTQAYAQEKTILKPDQVQTLCEAVRRALPNLHLFSPYFAAEQMGEFHRSIWDDNQAEEERSSQTDMLTLDTPLGENDDLREA